MLGLKVLVFILLVLICFVASAAEVRVAVAANFLATLKALAPLYEEHSGDRLVISGGSSGKLYAQIVNGAPYDVFLSADTFYPQKLVENGKGVKQSRFIYAKGLLVLWSKKQSLVDAAKLDSDDVKHIAIANPKTAPYGSAAIQTMQKINIFEGVKSKLVKGESVGQTFQFVASGNAQIGFVALSQVLNPNNKYNGGYWPVPIEYYSPLDQQAILIKDNEESRQFLNFLRSPKAQEVIKQFGYL